MNIKQAKQLLLEDVLRQLGHAPSRVAGEQLWYVSPFRNETTPSFKVNRAANLWYDFGEGKGGDVLDLVQRVEGLPNVSETLTRLDALMGAARPTIERPRSAAKVDEPPALQLVRAGPVQARSLKNYLQERGIDPRIVGPGLQEVHYCRGDKSYFALGMANSSGGYELRNPWFKGTLGSKDISVLAGNTSHVAVFEGMFDYLTAVQLAGGPLNATAIVLNSVSLRERALDRIHELNPRRVDVYRDRDAAGEQLIGFFREQLPGATIIDQSKLYPDHKDINDWYCSQSCSTHLARV